MAITDLRQLAERRGNGLQVTLNWDPRSDAVSLEIVDVCHDRTLVVSVAAASALDAFYHPYAYVAA